MDTNILFILCIRSPFFLRYLSLFFHVCIIGFSPYLTTVVQSHTVLFLAFLPYLSWSKEYIQSLLGCTEHHILHQIRHKPLSAFKFHGHLEIGALGHQHTRLTRNNGFLSNIHNLLSSICSTKHPYICRTILVKSHHLVLFHLWL